LSSEITVWTNAGKWGESLTYPLLEESDIENDAIIQFLADKLEEIRCVEIGKFPADLQKQSIGWVPRKQDKEKAPLYIVSFDGLKGGHIFLVAGKQMADSLVSLAVQRWGQLPLREEMKKQRMAKNG